MERDDDISLFYQKFRLCQSIIIDVIRKCDTLFLEIHVGLSQLLLLLRFLILIIVLTGSAVLGSGNILTVLYG